MQITINNNFSTNFEGLYFLGDSAHEVLDQDQFFIESSAGSLQKEAQFFSDFILGGNPAALKELYNLSLKTETIEKFLSAAEGSYVREAKT